MRGWPSRTRPAAAQLLSGLLSGLLLGALGPGCAGEEPQPQPAERPQRLDRFTFASDEANQPAGERLDAEEALVAQDGSQTRLSAFRGRPVVLVFTRGWIGHVCPYCATYTAQIAFRYDELAATGAEVLLVYPTPDEGQGRIDEFTAAVQEVLEYDGPEGLPFPVFLDPGLRATKRFHLEGDLSKPSTFVLDAEGVVRFGYVGDEPHERPSVDKVLEELRALSPS